MQGQVKDKDYRFENFIQTKNRLYYKASHHNQSRMATEKQIEIFAQLKKQQKKLQKQYPYQYSKVKQEKGKVWLTHQRQKIRLLSSSEQQKYKEEKRFVEKLQEIKQKFKQTDLTSFQISNGQGIVKLFDGTVEYLTNTETQYAKLLTEKSGTTIKMFIRFLKIIKIKYDFSLGTECIYHNDKMLRPLTEEEFAEYKKFRYPGTSSEKHIPLNVMQEEKDLAGRYFDKEKNRQQMEDDEVDLGNRKYHVLPSRTESQRAIQEISHEKYYKKQQVKFVFQKTGQDKTRVDNNMKEIKNLQQQLKEIKKNSTVQIKNKEQQLANIKQQNDKLKRKIKQDAERIRILDDQNNLLTNLVENKLIVAKRQSQESGHRIEQLIDSILKHNNGFREVQQSIDVVGNQLQRLFGLERKFASFAQIKTFLDRKIHESEIFIGSQVLVNNLKGSYFLIENIQRFTQKSVIQAKIKLILRPNVRNENFIPFLPTKSNQFSFLILWKLKSSQIIGSFSQGVCSQNSKSYQSFLFNLTATELFFKVSIPTVFPSVSVHNLVLSFGNNELVVLNNKSTLMFQKEIVNNYYHIPDKMLMSYGQNEYEVMEIYQIQLR